jgi:hypothetical protein
VFFLYERTIILTFGTVVWKTYEDNCVIKAPSVRFLMIVNQ